MGDAVNVKTIIAAAAVAAASIGGLAACGSSHNITPSQAHAQAAVAASAAAKAAAAKQAAAKAAAAKQTAAAAAPAPAPLPVLSVGDSNDYYSGIKPAMIDYSADGGNVVTSITWSSWTADSAVGNGTSNLQGCVPNCAEGTETPVPATITLSDPVNGQFTASTEVRDGQTTTEWPQFASQNNYNPAPVPAPAQAGLSPLTVVQTQLQLVATIRQEDLRGDSMKLIKVAGGIIGALILLIVIIAIVSPSPKQHTTSAPIHAPAAATSVPAASHAPAVKSTTAAPTHSAAPAPTHAAHKAVVPAQVGLTVVHDPGQVTGVYPSACSVRDGDLPDPNCTPGSVDPAVTQANISTTICRTGYTETVRPPTSETDATKADAYTAYSIPSGTTSELDHLVSLELGGSNDVTNLWPEAGGLPNPKDSVEDALHHAVCSGQVPLAAAQRAIAANWTTAESSLGVTTSAPVEKAPAAPVNAPAAPASPAAPAQNIVHPGSFCSVDGQHGISKAGNSYVCAVKGGHDRWERS